jgi:hypothetical protein
MPVFGDLKDFPLVEVLPLLAFRRGALHVAMPESSNVVTLYFDQQAICGVRAENRLLDPLDALLVLRKLLGAKQGVFWFEQDTAPEGPAKLAWPVEQLLLELAKETDESVVVSQELPDPATRFRLTEGETDADVSLSDRPSCGKRSLFWRKGFPWLSSRKLCRFREASWRCSSTGSAWPASWSLPEPGIKNLLLARKQVFCVNCGGR